MNMELEDKITIAAIATIISSIISSIVGLTIARINVKKTEERSLDALLIQINTLCIQYPYFENKKFISKYSHKRKKKEEEKYSRYDSYCTIIFNFLERLFVLYNFNENKVNKFVHFRELVLLHSEWWIHSDIYSDNIKGYNEKFVSIISNIIASK